MPIPVLLAIGTLLGRASKEGKEDFQAINGRKKKDGTTGKAYLKKKSKSR
jgi:hypothetical protein